jgi:DNA topoisomerase III
MKESGLGTPATRASIIEVLLKRGYIVRTGKTLEATDKGIHLVDVVHSEVKSPVMTGQWEAFLRRIQQGDSQLDLFLEKINDYVRSVVSRVRQTSPRKQVSAQAPTAANQSQATKENETITKAKLLKLLKSAFGFSSFLPNQDSICKAITSGKDALVVMPSGSGISLCYHLSGLALGGTTLIFGTFSTAMEDEVKELKLRGLSAECIHSGFDRETSRGICSDYLRGKLQFFFIDPERLSVTGFPEMLAKRKPCLLAVRDAHCISQLSDQFCPDYLQLTRYLPSFRPAATLAYTTNATAKIQEEIVSQLELSDPVRIAT